MTLKTNKIMKQTAVEWLEKRLLGIVFLDTEYSTIEYEKRIDKAKEMEKQQQDEFAIEFADWKDKFISSFDDLPSKGVYLKNRYTTKELLEIYKNK